MKNNIKQKVATAAAAVVIGATTLLGGMPNAIAETKATYKQGTFLENQVVQDTETNATFEYGYYVVKEGDNLSRISEKITRHLGAEQTTKYWPVLAYLNGYPRVIQPGDLVFFPADMEVMDQILAKLKKGWLAKYINANNIYKEKNTVRRLLEEIYHEWYGDDVCVDPDFIRLYLHAVGLGDKYDGSSPITDTEMMFHLTEWIPTLEQLEEYQDEHRLGR